MFFGARAGSHEQNRTIREAETPGKRPAKEVHLIEAAFSRALPVKWHGDENVSGQPLGFLVNKFGETIGKPTAQRRDLLMLQKQYGASESALVKTITARKLKGEPALLTIRAEGKLLGKLRIEGSGQSAKITTSRRYFRDGRETVVTEGKAAGIGEELSA